jgi:hypothetical protein
MRRELSERAEQDPSWNDLLDRVVRREIDPSSAARELLDAGSDD